MNQIAYTEDWKRSPLAPVLRQQSAMTPVVKGAAFPAPTAAVAQQLLSFAGNKMLAFSCMKRPMTGGGHLVYSFPTPLLPFPYTLTCR